MDRRLKIRQKIRPRSCNPCDPYETYDPQDSHGSHNSHGIHKLIARLPKTVRLFGLLGLCLAACMVGHPSHAMAATSAGNAANNPTSTNADFQALPAQGDNIIAVGRYQFNYTGNINYYSAPSSGSDDIQQTVFSVQSPMCSTPCSAAAVPSIWHVFPHSHSQATAEKNPVSYPYRSHS